MSDTTVIMAKKHKKKQCLFCPAFLFLYFVTFLPKYYFIGFTQGAMNRNINLPQTIGWENTNQGGANGTFDPLAE